MAAKRVESFRVPCLDAGSTPATSTENRAFMRKFTYFTYLCTIGFPDKFIVTMLSILFFIKRRKPLKDGSVPIFMRVSSHQEYVECSLRRSTMPSQWVTAKGRVRNNTLVNKQLNEYLDQQEFRLY